MVAYIAGNMVNKDVELVHWSEVPALVESGACLIDVRTPDEAQGGMVPGAFNISVDEIRSRLDDIPKDKELLVYCQVGVRSYIASRILKQKGFKVKSISGGYNSYRVIASQ